MNRPPMIGDYDTFIFDLDGVVYRGEHAVPGAIETIQALTATGAQCVYVTNNAGRPGEVVAEHLRSLGLSCSIDQVITSPQAVAAALPRFVEPGALIYVVGGPGIDAALIPAGYRVTREPSAECAAVVQGFGPDVAWRDLAEAAYLVESGVPWLVTNPDLTFPTARGIAPGNGALAAAVGHAVGRNPDLIAGKPEPPLLQTALQRTGARRALMVGDRLDTDIEAGHRVGIDTAFVATGAHRFGNILHASPDQRPTYLGADLRYLLLSYPEDQGSAGFWGVAQRLVPEAWAARDQGDTAEFERIAAELTH